MFQESETSLFILQVIPCSGGQQKTSIMLKMTDIWFSGHHQAWQSNLSMCILGSSSEAQGY